MSQIILIDLLKDKEPQHQHNHQKNFKSIFAFFGSLASDKKHNTKFHKEQKEALASQPNLLPCSCMRSLFSKNGSCHLPEQGRPLDDDVKQLTQLWRGKPNLNGK